MAVAIFPAMAMPTTVAVALAVEKDVYKDGYS